MKDWDEEKNPLRGLTRKPPSPELKANVLNTVRKNQLDARALTPFLRIVLAVSLGLAGAAVLTDGILSRTSEKRMAVLGLSTFSAESSPANSYEEMMQALMGEYSSEQERTWLRRQLQTAKRAELKQENTIQKEIFEEIIHEFSN